MVHSSAAAFRCISLLKKQLLSISHQNVHSNKCIWGICALFGFVQRWERKISRFKCLAWPDSFGLTDWTSRRRTQQRKTGKCQERLTKHIPQRLPFKAKREERAREGGRERGRDCAEVEHGNVNLLAVFQHYKSVADICFPTCGEIVHKQHNAGCSRCNNLWPVNSWINIHVAVQCMIWLTWEKQHRMRMIAS